MTPGTKSILVVSLCAALLGGACKKKSGDVAGSGSATATGSAAAMDAAAPPAIDAAEAPAIDAAEAAAATSTTPELKALDDTIAPILAMQDEAARTKAACAALDDLKLKKIRAVSNNPPAGVDPAAWNDIAERMSGALDTFAIQCGEGSASNTTALSEAVEIEKEFQGLLAKKAP